MTRMRDRWGLDPDIRHLNHGSFGATPTAVLAVQDRLRARLEANPTRFMEDEYQHGLDSAREAVAGFVGASVDDLAFVTNATGGVAAVVGSLDLRAGDEVLTTDHAYNACRNILEVAAARAGARLVVAPIRFPDATCDQAVAAVLDRVTPATRLVLVDHVTSPTALVLPVEPIVAALEPDIPVLIDGAHAPGMVPVDLDLLGASFYTGNLHKWVCAPKGAGFVSVADRHRDQVRPTVISHGWNTPRGDAGLLHRLFDWTGTFDPTAWLSVPAALTEMASMHADGWPGVMAANRDLARAARDLLCDRLGVPAPAPDGMLGSMAAVPLAFARAGLGDRLRSAGMVALVSEWPDASHAVLRVSAQLYNHLGEYEELAAAVLAD